MTDARARALAEAERIARGKEKRRDELVRFLRAAKRARLAIPRAAIDGLAAEVDAAAYWRALADGHRRPKAMELSSRARKKTRSLLN